MPSLVRPLFCVLFFLVASSSQAQDPVSFRNEVMAVLSRAGCNQGICHGNLNGRGGLKLSLRGQDLDFDREALTRGMLGRRVNPLDPDASLMLQKATGQVAHEGGPRIAAGTPLDPPGAAKLKSLKVTPIEQYLVAPLNEITVHAQATFSDGTTKDV